VAHAARDHTAGVDSHRLRGHAARDLPVRAARQRRGVRQLVRAAYQAAFDDNFMRLHFPNMRV